MQLGTVITRLQDEPHVEEMLALLDDWVLLARLRNAADAAGVPLSELASQAIAAFLTSAGDESWLALMTAANRAPDPAVACLKTMLEFGLSRGPAAEPPAAAPA